MPSIDAFLDSLKVTDKEAKIEAWQKLWGEAKVARGRGQVSRALSLYEAVAAQNPKEGTVYLEMAEFIADLERDLASVQELYEGYHKDFHLSNRTPTFPLLTGRTSDEDAADRMFRALRMACELEPGNIAWQLALADAHEWHGAADKALEVRRGVANVHPRKYENELAIVRLLDALGRSGDARDKVLEVRRRVADARPHKYDNELIIARLFEALGRASEAAEACEMIIARTLSAPEAMLRLARLRETAHQYDEAQTIYGDLVRLVRTDWSAPAVRAEFLFRLARAAAIDGLSASAEPVRDKLFESASSFAHSHPGSIAAQLALGFAALVVQDKNTANRSFATASWLASHEDRIGTGRRDDDSDLRQALSFARGFILGVAHTPSYLDLTPAVRADDLTLIHAHWLGDQGHVKEAMEEYARWLDTAHVIRLREVHRGYRIFRQNGIYYAVPLTTPVFVILHGSVYRVPDFVLVNLSKLPPRIRGAIRLQGRRIQSVLSVEAGRSDNVTKSANGFRQRAKFSAVFRASLGSCFRVLLAPQRVGGVLCADDRWTLIAKIDAHTKPA